MEYLEEVVNALLLGESINVFVRPAIVKLRRKVDSVKIYTKVN